jgi:hypothetical protein
MALTIKTDNPSGLLTAIKKAIDDKTIATWSYDNDGDFTHTPEQWKNKAWLRPKIETGELKFIIISPKDTTVTKAVSGIYHGRFIEMLTTHFETKFSTATATIPL